MSDQQKDTFVGKHQQVAVKDGFFTKVGISKADFDKFSENGWLNLKVNKARDGRCFLVLDTWKPDPSKRGMSSAKNVGDVFNTLADMTRPISGDESLPF